MKIEARPSPNFNDRKHPIDMLVFHYTGMETGQQALDRMCDAAAEVSAHYMIWEDGRIVQLVGEDKRAWHAGVSSWQGDNDLNSRSIGIEIVNGGHDWPLTDGRLPAYPDAQIDALIELSTGIIKRWDIPFSRIVGHSDIAPDRKDDPGEHFPWDRLAQAGIGAWPISASENPTDPPGVTSTGHTDEALGLGDDHETVRHMRRMLQEIGYGLEDGGTFDEATAAVVRAFQRRWRQDQVTGRADSLTLRMVILVHSLFSQ
ncbi:MAG: N-acetylmuramoyl-L-alanine amidase [Pseudomonadota bacterium]